MREILTRESTLAGAAVVFVLGLVGRYVAPSLWMMIAAGFLGGMVAGALTRPVLAPTGPGGLAGGLGATAYTVVLLVSYAMGTYSFSQTNVLPPIVRIAGPLLEFAGFLILWGFMGILGALLGQKLLARTVHNVRSGSGA